ncbi:hypothetical protein DYT72_17980 [Escherichia coli]|nr:hypothetical protein [Escherichia coli]
MCRSIRYKKALRGFFCTCQSAGFTITSVIGTIGSTLVVGSEKFAQKIIFPWVFSTVSYVNKVT